SGEQASHSMESRVPIHCSLEMSYQNLLDMRNASNASVTFSFIILNLQLVLYILLQLTSLPVTRVRLLKIQSMFDDMFLEQIKKNYRFQKTVYQCVENQNTQMICALPYRGIF